MPTVILVSTEHRESGNCNSNELCKIFKSLNPDVIFEEETNDDKYQSYYGDANSFKSLEIQSIIKYKQKYSIRHIPVDATPNQYLSFHDWDYLFNTFNKYDTYKQIVKEHCTLRDKFGFAYLNSEKCTDMLKRMKIAEAQIIEFSGINKNELARIYALFHQEHDYRENTMLLNIYNFTKENQYRQAVFMLGFAHRNSMIEKISKYREEDDLKIDWIFYNENYQTGRD